MHWFLVILFWSPVTGDFEMEPGLEPIQISEHELCQTAMEMTKRIILADAQEVEYVIDCVYTTSDRSAVELLRSGSHRGQAV